MNLVSALNEISQVWLDYTRNSLIDTIVLLGIVGSIWLLLSKRLSAQVGCCLFLLVIIKAAIPLEIPGPRWLAALSPRQQWQQWTEKSPATSHNRPPTEFKTLPATDTSPVMVTTTNNETVPAVIAPAAMELANQPPQRTTPTAATGLMIVWGSAVCVMVMRFAWIHIQFSRRLRSATRVDGNSLPIDLDELRRVAGLRQAVRYFIADEISSPAVWGSMRPCLLLPSDFFQTYSPEQMRWILLHEFAHIRHRDLWIAIFQRLVQILHVFNPAVWIANGMIYRLREFACDDAALLAADVSRRECGNALLRAVEVAHTRPPALEPALGVFRPGRVFRNRLIRILDTNRRVHGRMPLPVTGALVLLAALMLPSVHGDDGPKPKSKSLKSPAAKVDPHPPRFAAHLPGGGSVELVSVSKHPSEDGPWWRADGSPIDELPYVAVEGKLPVGNNMMGLDFAFQFHGLAAETVRDVDITFLASGTSSPMDIPVDAAGKPLPDLRIKSAGIANDTTRIDFRIGIPTGEWKSIATHNGLGGGSSSKKRKGAPAQTVTFLPPRQIESLVSVNFAHNIKDQQIQVVAIEKDGKTRHVHSHLTQVGGKDFSQAAVEFEKLNLENIQEFRVEVRNLQYVYFKSVSTVRGFETDVTVEDGKTLTGAAPGWGSFSGQFLFGGPWPQPNVLVEKGDTDVKDAAISAAQTIYSEELVVDKRTMGIKNIFVYLMKPPAEIHPDLLHSESKEVVFDVIGCRFVPHTLFARTDQTVLLKSADPIMSNVHGYPNRNSGINIALRPRDRSGSAVMFNKPEPAPFPVSSDYHRWMKAHWLILDHPYAAITDREGKFEINNLPAGTHEFVVWHEKFGWLEKSLTIDIEAGKTVKLATQKIGRQANHPNAQRPFVAKGRVTDSDGQPLADVKVGTHLSGVHAATTTNANGDYELHFGHGPLAGEPDFVRHGVIYAMKPGWFESNLFRQAEVLITMNQQNQKLDSTPAQENLFLPLQPKTVNFEMARSAEIRGVVLDANGQPFPQGRPIYLEGPEMPPYSSVAALTKLGERGEFVFSDVPTNFEWRFTIDSRGPGRLRSIPIHLTESRTHNARLQLNAGNDLQLLELK